MELKWFRLVILLFSEPLATADQLKKERVEVLRGIFDIDSKLAAIPSKRKPNHMPRFWDNPKSSREIAERNQTKKTGLDVFWKVANVQLNDPNSTFDFTKAMCFGGKLKLPFSIPLAQIETRDLRIWLTTARKDHLDAIVNINSGAGGTESRDWASMLRCVCILCRREKTHGYKVTEWIFKMEYAGIKSCSWKSAGNFAYGCPWKEKSKYTVSCVFHLMIRMQDVTLLCFSFAYR